MKVSDIMQRQIITVGPTANLKEVGKIIFGLQIAGVPVVKGKKLLGLITQTDILHKLYPSYQEFMEDYTHAKDFDAMEGLTEKILDLPASKIMNKNITTVSPDLPVMRVQSLMLTKGFGRVPVVDEKRNLVGIVSQGDIFRTIVGQKLPFDEDEQFHDWLSRHFDLLVDWDVRLAKEIEDFTRVFKKENVTSVLDIGCGTGRHVIALAKAGFRAVGVDRSKRMVSVARENAEELAKTFRDRVTFVHHEYKDLQKVLPETFDAVIFMGSALSHYDNPAMVLKEANKILNSKAIIICQITNFDKILNVQKRFFDFQIRESHLGYEREHGFLQFYDPKEHSVLTLNIAVFDRGLRHWTFRGMHATPVVPLDREKLRTLLKKVGFSTISFYGGEGGFYYDYLFRKPFKPDQSDQLIVVGKRR